jgi:hypothetical protein
MDCSKQLLAPKAAVPAAAAVEINIPEGQGNHEENINVQVDIQEQKSDEVTEQAAKHKWGFARTVCVGFAVFFTFITASFGYLCRAEIFNMSGSDLVQKLGFYGCALFSAVFLAGGILG